MKIVVLTSETLHHTYFVRELAKAFPLECVLVERNEISAPFATHHPFEDHQESYERDVLFKGNDTHLIDVAQTLEVGSVNDPHSLAQLKKIAPDVIVVFGTGKVCGELIRICPDGIINLHGGNPEKYRGLDTHLWAIYHNDFSGLVTTLHHLNERLDDGAIILQAAVPLRASMELYELRCHNTEVCIKLTVSALDMFNRWGYMLSRSQRECGRYYSFMPEALKEVCLTRFKAYTSRL